MSETSHRPYRTINANLSTVNVAEEVSLIAAIARRPDSERAHAREDALHRMVLVQIADLDVGLASRLAEAALGSRSLDFPRHCA